MRTWLVMAPYDGNGSLVPTIGEAEELDRLAIFTSGDGPEPEPGDLNAAVRKRLDNDAELLLVPLDDAISIDVRVAIETKVDVSSRGRISVPRRLAE